MSGFEDWWADAAVENWRPEFKWHAKIGWNAAIKNMEAQNTPTNTGSPKCEQCEHFDISQGVYTVECYSCKRYCGDMFTLRAACVGGNISSFNL